MEWNWYDFFALFVMYCGGYFFGWLNGSRNRGKSIKDL